MATISDGTDPVAAVMHAVGGGTFRIRLARDYGPGQRVGVLVDDAGESIGTATDWLYGGSGFAVHARAFAGYVPLSQIEFVQG